MNDKNALYIVATPIGNLNDISSRAIEVLRLVDVVAAEDTRHSGRLMQAHQINTPLISYHDHGGSDQHQRILSRLSDGQSVALISDAGTPLISDPGYRLVKCAREEGYRVIPIPGACAFIAALSASGLPSDRFAFEGFPPAKSAARRKLFDSAKGDTRTLIYYESPHRIEDSLADMAAVFGDDRPAVLARELTKTFETFLSGSMSEIVAQVNSDPNQRKGEMVVMVEGARKESNEDIPPAALSTMRWTIPPRANSSARRSASFRACPSKSQI